MTHEEEKLAELILYVADKTRTSWVGGATKLNKYLYFADFSAMRKLGRPITGVEYQKLRFGPAPRKLLPVRGRLVRSGDARFVEDVDAFGYPRHRLIAQRAPRTDLFTAEELQVVDEVIEALEGLSARQVVELSHAEAGWQLVEEGDTIPYALAFVVAPDRAGVTPAIKAEGERLRAALNGQIV